MPAVASHSMTLDEMVNQPFLPCIHMLHRGILVCFQAVFIYSIALRQNQAKFVEVAPEILLRILHVGRS